MSLTFSHLTVKDELPSFQLLLCKLYTLSFELCVLLYELPFVPFRTIKSYRLNERQHIFYPLHDATQRIIRTGQ